MGVLVVERSQSVQVLIQGVDVRLQGLKDGNRGAGLLQLPEPLLAAPDLSLQLQYRRDFVFHEGVTIAPKRISRRTFLGREETVREGLLDAAFIANQFEQ